MSDTHSLWHSRGYIPHFEGSHALQSITFRLADSLPQSKLLELDAQLATEERKKRFQKIEDLLDSGYGSCWLRIPEIARCIQETLLKFDGERYRLIAWVIMPNHVHVLIEVMPGVLLGDIVHSWKSFTAKVANKLLGRTGQFWQIEYFDRYMRDAAHMDNTIKYIEYNPVRARLCSSEEQWPYSSAGLRGFPLR